MAKEKNINKGKKNRSQTKMSTQTHLRISEIRDNTVILKDGGLRAVIKTTSINFNLKSEEEQNSIIYSYQNFLNSLEFPIQIQVRSKRLDVDNYIEQVKLLGKKQKNKLLQEQTFEYAEYIRRLVEYADIMEKEFYVIIPYTPGATQTPSVIQQFFQKLSPQDSYAEIKKRHKQFNELRKKLTQKVNVVVSGLNNCGLKTKELNTTELVELYYSVYNPNISRTMKLKNLDNTSVVPDVNKIEQIDQKEVSN